MAPEIESELESNFESGTVGQRAAAALRLLTIRQRDWVVRFVSTGNALASTRAVYRCKTDGSARVQSYALKSHPKIKRVLAVLDGVTEREIFLRKLEKSIDAADPGSVAQMRLHSLYARVAFGHTDGRSIRPEKADAEDDDGVQKFAVGSVVQQGGKRYKIVAEEIA
jgi:hypothetical protein